MFSCERNVLNETLNNRKKCYCLNVNSLCKLFYGIRISIVKLKLFGDIDVVMYIYMYMFIHLSSTPQGALTFITV